MTESDVKKKRPRRKQLNLCRICLTYSPSMKALNENFEEDFSIHEVLRKVLCTEILVTQQTPDNICSICLSFLKISYDFKKQFEATQKKLFGNLNHTSVQESTKNSKEVELIVGGKNYSLDDVVILDENEKHEEFSELLNNLGESVTVECKKHNEFKKVSNDSDITNNDSKIQDIDDEYETIIIEYISDSDNDELLMNDEGNARNTCATKSRSLSDIVGSLIIEDDKETDQMCEPIKNVSSLNEKHENLSIDIGTFKSKRFKKSSSAELKEIEKYIICEGGDLKYDFLYDSAEVKEIEKYIICEEGIAENKFNKIDGFSTVTSNVTNPEKSSYICQLVKNIEHHSGLPNEVNEEDILKYSCKACPFSFKYERSLKSHVSQVHGIKGVDDKETKRSEEIKIEMKETKKPMREKVRKQQFQKWKQRFKKNSMLCQICGHVALSSGGARYHSLTHDERRFKCTICSKKFFTISHLKNHLNCKHEKNTSNKYLCTLCGEYRNSSSALKYHMRIHNNEPRKYSCHVCGLSFLVPGALRTHLRRHMGDRRYSCNLCEKSFFTNNERKKHMMIHTGERPFKCKYCEKNFATPFNRKIHMMTHSGPNLCRLCFKGLPDNDLLKLHIKYKHCSKQIIKKKRPSSLKVVPDKKKIRDNITKPLSSTKQDGGTRDLLEYTEVDCETRDPLKCTEVEDGIMESSKSTEGDDIVILEVLNLLDAPEEGALQLYEVDVN